ncbi:hypothetical protein PG996_008805 [Apiospora saccharicola]|uniref:T6SS Phospholipase effector Tle1-like catalytic domain-containing protein n=1 Tax=Apiospora saccharicola TaxID=335842 RepID=A0ABR1UYZ7_9PEZI
MFDTSSQQSHEEEIRKREEIKSNHAGVEKGLNKHTRRLKRLINSEQIRPDGGIYKNAASFMNSVGENCEKKRIFICCDGTGNNASGTVDPMTNVAKLARAVDRIGKDKYIIPDLSEVDGPHDKAQEERRFGSVRQIVYYSSGVGTRSALVTDSLYASAFGKGLSANLLDGYCFLCNNYNGRSTLDEIILAGFSRGAFTVRCLARFINDVGVLRRSGLVFLQTIYKLWRANAGYKPPGWLAEWKWPETYRSFKTTLDALTDGGFITGPQTGVPIKVLAEWDTVSAMWGGPLSFVGNKVPGNVENAFQAVSLHEKRKMFKPMLWESEGNRETNANIKQCIFAGCHSDIGGGNKDPALSGASFFWMVAQIKDCGCNALFNHDATTLQYVIPIQVERKWWSWKKPPVGLQIQSFAEGNGWYAVVYWLSLGLWNGKRDSLWERFLEEEEGTGGNNPERGALGKGRKKHLIGLTVHTTVRLLYEHRYRTPAVEKGDRRLRCGLFKKYRPEEQRPDLEEQSPAPVTWRWAKRGTKPKSFLEEDKMEKHERLLFHSLLKQARKIHQQNPTEDWKPENKLKKDEHNEFEWTDINEKMKWDSIAKGCTYQQTFISLLEDIVDAHPDEDETSHKDESNDDDGHVDGDDDGGKYTGKNDPDLIEFAALFEEGICCREDKE